MPQAEPRAAPYDAAVAADSDHRERIALREWPAARQLPSSSHRYRSRTGTAGPDRAGPLRAEQVPGATVANERISSG